VEVAVVVLTVVILLRALLVLVEVVQEQKFMSIRQQN
jgi:hypothetical protein